MRGASSFAASSDTAAVRRAYARIAEQGDPAMFISLRPEAEVMAEAGLAWHVFPNMSVLQGITFALCYRTRPYGDDPDMCIFESYAIERFPEGEVPVTEWEETEATAEGWGAVLAQDFSNMEWVQKGMKSRGFRGPLPNPPESP